MISFLHGSGSKASEDGLLTAALTHSFNSRLFAQCALRVGATAAQPLLEKAALAWRSGQSAVEAGFVSQRYGFDILYRPHSVFHFLFDKPVLWDTYGFGAGYSGSFSRLTLSAASSINAKENGQAHVMLSLQGATLESSLLAGFQSYTLENQDNEFSLGLNTTGNWNTFHVHATAKYVSYAGYGHAANPTMVPGQSVTGFLEMSYTPSTALMLCAMSYYLNVHKRFDHEFYFEGLEGTWMTFDYAGLGLGGQWQKDDAITTLTPRVFLTIVPLPDAAELRVSFESTYIERSATSYRLMGEIWMRL